MYTVYVINMERRIDRRANILNQFELKHEFDLIIEPAIEHKIGSYGLWLTWRRILQREVIVDNDFFIICEDDHIFTENYTFEYFENSINEARNLDADILSGGVSWLTMPIQIRKHLFWLKGFNGLQFVVIFRKFYNTLLDAPYNEKIVADNFISSLTDNIFVIYPFISVQKEFGYSDVTMSNNKRGYVDMLFDGTSEYLRVLDKVACYYEKY